MRVKLRDRLRYWFDGTMDRGAPALIGWLGLASVGLVGVVSTLVAVFAHGDSDEHGGWPGVAWMSLLRTLDPGTMGDDSGHPLFLILMLVVTIGGIFIVSALIGVLTTGLEARIQELRKGKGRLVERGHTIVLGWSEQVFTVIAELAEANLSERRSCVVILADRDKVDMEDEIRRRIPDTGRTRVICRSGSPLRREDVELVSPDTAKSLMVLPPAGDEGDIDVMKVLLLLNSRVWRGSSRPYVAAAVQSSTNLTAARLAAGDTALVVDADDIAVRLIAQSHRQAGLSAVFDELLSFYGNEFYPWREPALTGATYGEALGHFELGIPVGLHRADGTIKVNPPMDAVIGEGDRLLMIAEDDLLIRAAAERTPVVRSAVAAPAPRHSTPDHTLVIGWNARAAKLILLLDRLVEPGSVVDVAAPLRPKEDLQGKLENITLGYRQCEPTVRPSLDSVGLDGYRHIVVLADDGIDPARADDRTLVTLLHLRDIELRLDAPYSIVTEMNDDSNREVAQVTEADDFIVSTKVISLLLTQLTENRHLYAVFADLFDPEGSEIYLKPAYDYVVPGEEANFATVIEAARQRGETAIGYRVARQSDAPPRYGVFLNPPKAEPLALEEADTVVVLAES
ncbi:potassium transporter TrkA [Streptomyces sp. ODS28]|uniref:CASTOR/POLLUX-related putative ion channel n=1 Tax=Streptomyces sp. ODS28 TaxID=3136688 RepID=UPI0031F0528D